MNGPVPLLGEARSVSVSPAHTCELLVTVMLVAGFTTTTVAFVPEQPFLSVTVRLYEPAIAALAPLLLGFWSALV